MSKVSMSEHILIILCIVATSSQYQTMQVLGISECYKEAFMHDRNLITLQGEHEKIFIKSCNR